MDTTHEWIFDNGGWKITTEPGYKGYYKNITARENLREQFCIQYRHLYSQRVDALRNVEKTTDVSQGLKQLVSDIIEALPPMLSIDKVLFLRVKNLYENIMITYFPIN